MRVAVVGLGTMGAQVLWQLATRVGTGTEIVGYETYAPGHSRGAAGGETRLYRTLQYEDPGYTPIADLADELYEVLAAESGMQVREISGSLLMGDPGVPDMRAALSAVESSHREYRVLDRAESRKEFPQFDLDPGDLTIWDRDGGTIFPERTVYAAARAAEKAGAQIVRRARVTAMAQCDDGSVRITANGEDQVFDRVVAAPGAWTRVLFPELSGVFESRCLVSAWFLPQEPGHLAGVLPFIRMAPTYAYGLPYADRTAFKLGLGDSGDHIVENPDTAPHRVEERHLDGFRECIARFMPGLEDYPMRLGTYFESFTRSGYEWVGPHPAMSNVVLLAGFSGHGFKMAPAFGRIGAELALDGASTIDLGFLAAGAASDVTTEK